MDTKYPLEVGSIIRKDKSFSITSYLYRANGHEGEAPYDVYGKFSRFVFSILDMSGGIRKSTRINVNPNDVADIVKRSEYALHKQIEAECETPVEQTGNNACLANSVTFNMGTLKGKTPLSVLAEGNAEELKKQRVFLQANVGKYPANQKLINAIDDAFKQQMNGNPLNVQTSVKTASICLYSSGMKPQQRKKRADGKCEVNEMKITWDVGNKYPVTIEIVNYYATVIRFQDGRLNVKEPDPSSRVVLRAKAGEAEWMNILRKMETNMQMFEILQTKATFAEAEAIYNAQLATARNAKQWY